MCDRRDGICIKQHDRNYWKNRRNKGGRFYGSHPKPKRAMKRKLKNM